MKIKIFFCLNLLSLFIFCNTCLAQTPNKFHNKIDDIQTADDIKTLLVSIDKNFENFKINNTVKFTDDPVMKSNSQCQQLADKLKITSWTKTDFDNNGYTDLLVIGESYQPSIIVIMDMGKDKFIVKPITKRNFEYCALAKINSQDNQKIISYYDSANNNIPRNLIYKFGDFIEVNNAPKRYKIEKIEYQTGMCFGTCPVFKLTINTNRNSVYNAEKFNKKDGAFKGIIDKQKYNELTDLLNYIDFPNLNNNYSVSWTDDQTSILTITYNNGKIKKIKDYGLIGTYGLSRVYQMLFDLRENQTWK